jgi:hypothetical protein
MQAGPVGRLGYHVRKLPKVALLACMRQLTITFNALVRDQRPWQPRSAQ